MKVKTSITLTRDLIGSLDDVTKRYGTNRSRFIEQAVRSMIDQLSRNERNARDLEIINRRAEFLNREAEDALDYQSPP
jgi:metal-responsive CopG/Arc/MetJ family transcriptional regulator